MQSGPVRHAIGALAMNHANFERIFSAFNASLFMTKLSIKISCHGKQSVNDYACVKKYKLSVQMAMRFPQQMTDE